MATINLRARPLQLGSRRPHRLLLPRSHKEGSARMMEVVSQQRDNVCPLWVISGHVRLREKASALPLKADILGAGQRCPLLPIPDF